MGNLDVIKKFKYLNAEYKNSIYPFVEFQKFVEDEIQEGELAPLHAFISEQSCDNFIEVYCFGLRWIFCFQSLIKDVNKISLIDEEQHIGKVEIWCGYGGSKDVEVGSFLFNGDGLTNLPDPDKLGEYLNMTLSEHAVFIISSYITDNYRTVLKGDVSFEFILLD